MLLHKEHTQTSYKKKFKKKLRQKITVV